MFWLRSIFCIRYLKVKKFLEQKQCCHALSKKSADIPSASSVSSVETINVRKAKDSNSSREKSGQFQSNDLKNIGLASLSLSHELTKENLEKMNFCNRFW